ncbi:MAG: hypothetical protein R3C49_14500 [Planctomycetaceae bacterium]
MTGTDRAAKFVIVLSTLLVGLVWKQESVATKIDSHADSGCEPL